MLCATGSEIPHNLLFMLSNQVGGTLEYALNKTTDEVIRTIPYLLVDYNTSIRFILGRNNDYLGLEQKIVMGELPIDKIDEKREPQNENAEKKENIETKDINKLKEGNSNE